ncbi:MAG: response regulator transcription factor [Clostridia bacterium]|nr:response regulator transcription factor [Clostridia bacterium]
MAEILIVEDEINISNLIKMALSQHGHKTNCVFDGESCADILEKKHFDLVLLDVMLPKISGFELMDYIKSFDTPVIFITAKADVSNKVYGLNLGADDYITKPFNISELQARVDAVLRRYNKTQTKLNFGDITVDTDSRVVTKNNTAVDLTLKEYEILLLFIRNKNIALYREMIYERVWNEPYMGDTRTVDLHIQRLRKKLGLKNNIRSVYKVGYRLTDNAEENNR